MTQGPWPMAKKSLGQNFLCQPKICSRIVQLLGSKQSEQILEIGPGHGALTKHLVSLAPRALVLVEKDATLARECQKTYGSMCQCVLADALQFAWERLDETWVVLGNLPYNIASPLLFDLTSRQPHIAQGVFMVQKEVAQRICASPGSKAYGALGIWVQSFVAPTLAFVVPPSCFWPKPKVDSAVISYIPRVNPWPASLQKPLWKLLQLCFQKRRKQMGGILRAAKLPNWEAGLASVGLDLNVRPEEISVPSWHALTLYFASSLS
ncbi:MAG: ribosomal RNA small subunit methyltransferase A [Desulfovibrionaceae bacterium]|nr:ribosomal RNA small subunit methyltransferase A [Desulfovibrionaceae bacterium]